MINISLKKSCIVVGAFFLLFVVVGTSLSAFEVGKWDLRVVDNWKIIDPHENCLLNLTRAIESHSDEWCKELSSLYNRMFSAALSKDLNAYIACYSPESVGKNKKKFISEMKRLRKASNAWVLKKCMWGKKLDGKLYVLVVASTKEKISMHDSLTPHLRLILYAVKTKDGLKFTKSIRDRKLDKIIKRELFPSLQVYMNRPAEEIRLEKEFKKNRAKLEAALEKKEDFDNWFLDGDRKAALKSYGYDKKALWKLYYEVTTILPKPIQEIEESNSNLFFKYALSTGKVKIFKRPILIKDFLNEKTPRIKKANSFLDEMYLLVYKDAHYTGKYPNIYKRFQVDRFILWAYCIREFRGIEYLDLWGAIYSRKKDYICSDPFFQLRNYYRKVGDLKWQFIPYVYKENKKGDVIHYEHELIIIKDMLPIYLQPNIELVMASGKNRLSVLQRFGPAKLSDFEKYCSNSEFYKYFSIRPDSECLLYEPGMELMKIPVIPPESYKFPELDKALKKLSSPQKKDKD